MSADEAIEDGGYFATSAVYDHDPVRTHEELLKAGQQAQRQLLEEALNDPQPMTPALLLAIHRAWFAAAFPLDGGRFRSVEIVSRRPHVSPANAVPDNVAIACDGFEDAWNEIGGNRTPDRRLGPDQINAIVNMANGIAVRLHHVHPFRDGNTRTCLLLRGYLLQRSGLPMPHGRHLEQRHREAWNAAQVHDWEALNHVVIDQLGEAIRRLTAS